MFHIVMLDTVSLGKLFEMGCGPTIDELERRLQDSFDNEKIYYYIVPSEEVDNLDDVDDTTIERVANMLSLYCGKLDTWRRMPWNRVEIVVQCLLPYWPTRGK